MIPAVSPVNFGMTRRAFFLLPSLLVPTAAPKKAWSPPTVAQQAPLPKALTELDLIAALESSRQAQKTGAAKIAFRVGEKGPLILAKTNHSPNGHLGYEALHAQTGKVLKTYTPEAVEAALLAPKPLSTSSRGRLLIIG